MFQGFTPYIDPLMNVRMALYCVRVQNVEGRLSAGEGAITLGMIDDALQAVTLSDDVSAERLADFADVTSISTA